MKKINVDVEGGYTVYVGEGLLSSAELICSVKPPCKVMLLSDSNVYPIYGERVLSTLKNSGYQVCTHIIAAGEGSKNMQTVIDLLEEMGNSRLTRGDILVALGGGVVGDIGGFAASLYQRGIDYIGMPTTLLAAVDSSVGGKTGVDLECGKNMAGTFWQPSAVICDTDTFKTLSSDIYRSGMAEVIKYGFVFGATPWEMDIPDMVEHCIKAKASVVERDTHDRGERMLLNFGHTIGHGIEKASGYKVPHGLAVAIGMVAISRAAEGRGLCPKGSTNKLIFVLESKGLPTTTDIDKTEIKKAVRSDKKRGGDGVTIVIYDKLHKISFDELDMWIDEGLI